MTDPSTREPAIRVVMMPRDTNAMGTIFGGIILSYIDQAGVVEAGRHTERRLATVAMHEVSSSPQCL
jgi:acyl-CoA thioesterase YciA